jgi:hypothetical protein
MVVGGSLMTGIVGRVWGPYTRSHGKDTGLVLIGIALSPRTTSAVELVSGRNGYGERFTELCLHLYVDNRNTMLVSLFAIRSAG